MFATSAARVVLPSLVMTAAVLCLIPAAVLATFGLTFTLLNVPTEPYVDIVRQAYRLLPMEHALVVLPAAAVVILTATARLFGAARSAHHALLVVALAVLAFGIVDRLVPIGSL